VHRASITGYLPAKEKSTGAGVIVAPGGGFGGLWIADEGYRVGTGFRSLTLQLSS
jgi:hypothetical protein